jgi:Na+/H+-dicarboxylate symporter
MKLNIAIALGLVAGLLLGLAAAITESPLLMGVATAVEPLGDAFMNLLKMVVIPLVASVIFVGVARMGDLGKLSRLGAGTLIFFAVTTVISVMLGMGVTKALLPFASEALPAAVGAGTTEAPSLPGPIDFLLSLIPSNPFAAAAEGALLPLIVFTVLVGAATSSSSSCTGYCSSRPSACLPSPRPSPPAPVGQCFKASRSSWSRF